MKFSHTSSTDLQNTLRLIRKSPPETDMEIEAFMEGVDSGEIDVPEVPPHLSPMAIVRSIRELRHAPLAPGNELVHFFAAEMPDVGMPSLRIAARNGDGSLSEETLRKMEESQGD